MFDGENEDRQMLWLIGAGLALVAAVTVTIVGLWPSGEDTSSTAAVPAYPESAGPVPGPSQPSPTAPTIPTSAPVDDEEPATGSRRSSASGEPELTDKAPPRDPPSGALPESGKPASAGDRTGIIADGDNCLDLLTDVYFLGNALTVRECDGTASQRWTVHEDGRLEVLGVCARAESGGLVRLRACAGDGALTWKSGSVGSVVNVDDGTCLTRGADESITVATCGRAGQDWTLPS